MYLFSRKALSTQKEHFLKALQESLTQRMHLNKIIEIRDHRE